MSDCLNESILFKLAQGDLELAESTEIEQHIDACIWCRRLVAETARVALRSGAATNSAPLDAPAKIARGTELGRYVILQRVGVGAMGVVYAAYDSKLDRKIALKLLHDIADDEAPEQHRDRLLREAQALARLSHPNVIAVYDVGDFAGQLFLSMEFVEGETLTAWLGARPRSPAEILEIFIAAGRGLSAAHRAGLVHRDFKPDNVLVGRDGRVRVTDFGLARRTARDDAAGTSLDQSSSAGGTPLYMAPEQHLGQAVDPRSDQFSFCVTLFEALANVHPFAARTRQELAVAVLRGNVRPFKPDARTPAAVERALRHGLSPRRDDRYPSMEALLEALAPARRRQQSLFVGGALVCALAALATAAIREARAPRLLCQGAEHKFDRVWDPQIRETIAAAFARSDKPYAMDVWRTVAHGLDDYSRKWAAMYTDACEATRIRGDQSEALLDRRMQCLDERQKQAAALSQLLLHADAPIIERAVDATSALPRIEACANVEELLQEQPPPTDAATRAHVDELQARLANAAALQTAGRISEALPLTGAIATASQALHYRPLEAKALLQRGVLQRLTGDHKNGIASLTNALMAAEAGRSDRVLLEVLTELIAVEGYLGHADEAARWTRWAAAVLERGGHDRHDAALLEYSLGWLSLSQRNDREARTHFTAAVAAVEPSGDEPLLASSLYGLGVTLGNMGQGAAAIPYFERARALREKLFGPRHPLVAEVLAQLSGVHVAMGAMDEALAEARSSLHILEAAFGSRTSDVARGYISLGFVHNVRGEFEDALECFLKGRARFRDTVGPDHLDTLGAANAIAAMQIQIGRYQDARAELEQLLATLTRTHHAQGDAAADAWTSLGQIDIEEQHWARALEELHRALAIAETAFGADSPQLWPQLGQLGRAWLGLGRPDKAATTLQRALSIGPESEIPPISRADIELALARALWDGGGDRQRALALAATAQRDYERAAAPPTRGLERVRAWRNERSAAAQ
jgi:tetratricopeptide (TPR) repeat protein